MNYDLGCKVVNCCKSEWVNGSEGVKLELGCQGTVGKMVQ